MIKIKLASASSEKVTIFSCVIPVINNQTFQDVLHIGLWRTSIGIVGYKSKLLLNKKKEMTIQWIVNETFRNHTKKYYLCLLRRPTQISTAQENERLNFSNQSNKSLVTRTRLLGGEKKGCWWEHLINYLNSSQWYKHIFPNILY